MVVLWLSVPLAVPNPPSVNLQSTPPSPVPYYALLVALIVIARIVTKKIRVRPTEHFQEKEWSGVDDDTISTSSSDCATECEDNDDEPDTSMSALLYTAASNLSTRHGHDFTTYISCLSEDLFTEVDKKDRSVECLSRYMPLRLAEEVHLLVEAANIGVNIGVQE